MKIRYRWLVLGGHTHVRVFVGNNFATTLGKAGDLVFDNPQWQAFQAVMEEHQKVLKLAGMHVEIMEDPS